jgi:hypothetical protein
LKWEKYFRGSGISLLIRPSGKETLYIGGGQIGKIFGIVNLICGLFRIHFRGFHISIQMLHCIKEVNMQELGIGMM